MVTLETRFVQHQENITRKMQRYAQELGISVVAYWFLVQVEIYNLDRTDTLDKPSEPTDSLKRELNTLKDKEFLLYERYPPREVALDILIGDEYRTHNQLYEPMTYETYILTQINNRIQRM